MFSFFHQLRQPQDSSLFSTNLCQFLYQHYLISFSQWPHRLNTYYSHFVEKETEAQRGEAPCLDTNPGLFNVRAQAVHHQATLSSSQLSPSCISQGAGFPGDSVVKNQPATQEPQEMQAWSLGHQEDPLEEGKATYSSILAWKISGTEEPGERATVQRFAKSWTQLKRVSTHGNILLRTMELKLRCVLEVGVDSQRIPMPAQGPSLAQWCQTTPSSLQPAYWLILLLQSSQQSRAKSCLPLKELWGRHQTTVLSANLA